MLQQQWNNDTICASKVKQSCRPSGSCKQERGCKESKEASWMSCESGPARPSCATTTDTCSYMWCDRTWLTLLVYLLPHVKASKQSHGFMANLSLQLHDFELPTVKYEFNKRNSTVRSLFRYVWLCIYRFCLVWLCCDSFKDFSPSAVYCMSLM